MKVELDGVAKYYGRRRLFEDVTASVGPGECLAVTGPNGSGKSTLLKILAGLVRPSTGTVRLLTTDNREIGLDGRTSRIGLLSPEIVFYPALTGCENIVFLNRAAGVTASPEDILTCCRTVGLAGREHDRLATYSTGMRQRLKFALLLALRPPVWLLDEPSTNLDAAGKELIANIIRQAIDAQLAVVIATNEAEETGYAGKRIALV